MHWYLALPLGIRLSLACAAVSAVLVVFLVSLASATAPRDELLEQSGTIIASQLAESSGEHIVEHDMLALQGLLADLTSQPLVSYANIVNEQQILLVESGSPSPDPTAVMQFTAPISVHGSELGQVEITLVGASSPILSPLLVLFLGAVVFSLVLLFVVLRLKALDQALQRMSHTLGSLLPDACPSEPVKSVADLQGVCEAMQKLVPLPRPAAAERRAVLAVRLPQLAEDTLSAKQLAQQEDLLRTAAEQWHGSLRECVDGWLLAFTTGQDTARRALASACLVQTRTDADIDYAIAINMEANTAAEQASSLRNAHWQRLCEETRQLTTRSQAVCITRLILGDDGVHEQVTVEQEESGDYRISGFGEHIEHQVAQLLPMGDQPALRAVV